MLPGALFHCWPSPRSIGSLTVWPVASRKVSYLCSERLHRVLAGRQLAQRLERVAEHARRRSPLVAGLQRLDVDAEDLRRMTGSSR